MSVAMTPAQVEDACNLLAESGVSLLEFMSLQQRLSAGLWRAVVSRSEAGAAVVVFNESEKWRQVLRAHGPAELVLAALQQLRAGSEAVMWDEGAVPLEAATLDELGFFPVERQSFTQDLSRVPLERSEPADLEVSVIGKSDHASARQLFAAAHEMTIAGLYTTLPHPPTLERCALEFDAYMSGAQGEVVPSACLVTKLEGKIVGVICCCKTDQEDTGLLLGLGVDPAGRGRGLSRVLVRGAQRALKEAGFSKMLFVTTDGNMPVHRLFTPEEIVGTESWPARLWLRNAPERLAKPR